MTAEERKAGLKLLEAGAVVGFRVLEDDTELSPDGENMYVRVELQLGDEQSEEDGDEPADLVEWASFGFIFVLAVLSFADARPRGISEIDFSSEDEFRISDLLECLSFRRGELRFRADYLRGRSMKTDITVRGDGTVTVTTWGRGKALMRWLDHLKGKKLMRVVSGRGGDPGSLA